uniref:Uncharacterized protein n=1 Tax=Anguilla anguilla TaxID=7936 RepID=A0A0E9WIY5_ANGAN
MKHILKRKHNNHILNVKRVVAPLKKYFKSSFHINDSHYSDIINTPIFD